MTTSRVLALLTVAGALLLPTTAQASDDEIRAAVGEGSERIVEQEAKVGKVARRFAKAKRPSRRLVRQFRAAARREADVIRDIRRDLLAPTADTDDVDRGRDLMAGGLKDVAIGLDRIDRALGRALRGGSSRALRRSIRKAQREVARGNVEIEKGEPLVGVDLTPDAGGMPS